ncbi:ribosome silencing factor [Oenococcus oeni]|uniref:Ribosomal silencing factor RsfS n=2 Tax=Oenococcus oeni TaxID=1247 RepID=Q04FE5_OENOB|nr:ribosome silencing factor [Oenococcus oeni]ABJ56827.1 Iojap family protein [Oenococcus oeni PSU-1]OIK68118.1 ribosome silencing factor [Oenococcus oeni]OIL14845.1 ribosome silencing factor [Oenococcus oeni]OIL29387.1 ribosome silencing factor [Oenococcus oeni]OIL81533.1 ribosome silencing factor [Oenococcus oeni]
MESKELLEKIVQIADGKKAENLIALDIRDLSIISDYFLIASADTGRQVQAIAEEIIDQLHKKGISVSHVEGLGEDDWVLLDYGDVVVHLFTTEKRDYYKLEHLWSEAKTVDLSDWITAEF